MSDFIASCSANGKLCCNGIREDFEAKHPVSGEKYKCVEWVNLVGTHPQTGDQINNWMCARVAHSLLLVENANKTRQVAASVDSHRNVFVSALPPQIQQRIAASQKPPALTPSNGTV